MGWCSVAPRPAFARLFHTRGIAIADPTNSSVWSVVCIFVKRGHRRHGIAGKLLDAAVSYASDHGASVVKGYPVADAQAGKSSGLSSGTVDLFTRAEFSLQGGPQSDGG
jgi:GNAT superfamily N-acetyltransferase